VRHGAAILEDLTAMLVEERPWHIRAEGIAIEALRASGIEYLGLRKTHIVKETPGSPKWRDAAPAEKSDVLENAGLGGKPIAEKADRTSMSLEAFASGEAHAFSVPWHAARILMLCEQFRRAVSRVAAPGQYRPSKQTVVEHMDEAASWAHEAGLHVQALWGKNFEGQTLKGIAAVNSARKGGAARRAETRPKTEYVLAAMKLLVAEGKSVSAAATIAANRRIGTSASANRALWHRHRADSAPRSTNL
jgi:hypothetical protein